MSDEVVLCVDDDLTVLKALRDLLGRTLGKNVQIEIAESGDEALEICNQLRVQDLQLGVVITDFIMPNMRGDELLVRIHETSPQTIKIMLTGQSNLEGVKRAINHANLYRFLEKPFNNADLVLTARSALQAYCHANDLEKQTRELKQTIVQLEQLVTELRAAKAA